MADESKIIVRQGDATDFAGNKSLTINLSNTPIDLVSYTGRFELCKKIVKDYSDLTSKSIEIILSADETLKLPTGLHYAAFKVFDADKKPCTILDNIPYEVLPMVVRNDE